MTGLLPSRDAFGFANTWPSQPALTVRTPFGTVPIGDAAGGLCGGMVYAVLDHWRAGRAPARDQPVAGEPLYRYIVRRLVDSWDLPLGVVRYYRWMLAPDADRTAEVLGRRVLLGQGVARRTLLGHWPAVRADLDAGTPVGLGLVTARGPDPRRLPLNHQVLAYGYDRDGSTVTLHVYDPNSGPRDDIAIRFCEDAAIRSGDVRPAAVTVFSHNLGIGGPVRGFFRTAYRPAEPPA